SPRSTLFPYTTLFRSRPLCFLIVDPLESVVLTDRARTGDCRPSIDIHKKPLQVGEVVKWVIRPLPNARRTVQPPPCRHIGNRIRSEEHTSELQSRENL